MIAKGSTQLIVIFIIIATIIISLFGFLFYQNQLLSQKIDNSNPPTTTPPQQSLVGPTVTTRSPIIPTVTSAPTSKPVVVFQPGGSFDTQTKSQIQSRIVDPFIDYYSETNMPIVSITVEPNTKSDPVQFPYLFDAIFTNGGNTGFVITKTNDQINWFVPECMGACQFSNAFKAKYPEIVLLSN